MKLGKGNGSRLYDILGQCCEEAARRATKDNVIVGNDLSVLEIYTPTWIDQGDWDNLIDWVWNITEWKKESQNVS